MKLRLITDSRAIQIPPGVHSQLPALTTAIQHLTQQYPDIPASTTLANLPDTFTTTPIHILALTAQEYSKRGYNGQGNMGIIGGIPTINYRIPMIDTETILHELIHAYDPKFRKGSSTNQRSPEGLQRNTTPHEIDAWIGSKTEMIKRKLAQLPPEESQRQLAELKTWLRAAKTDNDFDLNVPQLLNFIPAIYHAQPHWKRLASILYNELLG